MLLKFNLNHLYRPLMLVTAAGNILMPAMQAYIPTMGTMLHLVFLLITLLVIVLGGYINPAKMISGIIQHAPWSIKLFIFSVLWQICSLLWLPEGAALENCWTLLRQLEFALPLLLVLLIAPKLNTEDNLNNILWAYVWGALIAGIVVLTCSSVPLDTRFTVTEVLNETSLRYIQPNALGFYYSLDVLILIYLYLRKNHFKERCIIVLHSLLPLLLLVLSFSKTSLLALIVVMGFFVFYAIKAPIRKIISAAFMAIITVAGIIILLPKLLAYTDGMTLSGRVTIWQFVLGMIQQSPIIGYGYRSYPIYAALQSSIPSIAHSHNDLLQRLLEGGIIGAFFSFGSVVCFIYESLAMWRIKAHTRIPQFAMGFVLFSVIRGITEASALHLLTPFLFIALAQYQFKAISESKRMIPLEDSTSSAYAVA